jgi:hypothetical protein
MTALLVVHSLIAYSVFYSLIAYPVCYTLVTVTAVFLVESWLAQSSSDDSG